MPDLLEEKTLVLRCIEGDLETWEIFVRRYAPPLARVVQAAAVRALGRADRVIVEDILQETFAGLAADRCKALRRFQWRCSLLHFLCVLALRRTQRVLHGAGDRPIAMPPEMIELLTGGTERHGAGDLAERVAKALEELPPRQKLALQMTYWEALPPQVVARALGLEPNALYALLFRARERLRGILRNGLFSL